jgi:hypothetical protein
MIEYFENHPDPFRFQNLKNKIKKFIYLKLEIKIFFFNHFSLGFHPIETYFPLPNYRRFYNHFFTRFPLNSLNKIKCHNYNNSILIYKVLDNILVSLIKSIYFNRNCSVRYIMNNLIIDNFKSVIFLKVPNKLLSRIKCLYKRYFLRHFIYNYIIIYQISSIQIPLFFGIVDDIFTISFVPAIFKFLQF